MAPLDSIRYAKEHHFTKPFFDVPSYPSRAINSLSDIDDAASLWKSDNACWPPYRFKWSRTTSSTEPRLLDSVARNRRARMAFAVSELMEESFKKDPASGWISRL